MYVGDYLARRCVYTPDQTAIIDGGRSSAPEFSYTEMNDRANRLANGLQAEGIGRGDRVAMLAYDGLHHYDAFFACCKLGAVYVPLNWRLSPEEIEYQVDLTEPRLLIHGTNDRMRQLVESFRDRPGAPQLHSVSDDPPTLQGLMATESSPVTCESVTKEDTACLLFTGGTTGRPKAAKISHRQIVWNTFNARLGDVRETDTFVNIFPLFHAGGFFAFSVPLLILGGTVVQTRRFDPDEVLRLIDDQNATIFGGVPTIFQKLTDASAWADASLDSLRFCMSGGAPMPVSLIQEYQEEKGVVFRQGYGMTEFGPGVFSLASEDAERKAGSIGKPNYFVDARIVDVETNEPLPQGETGELVLRGPSAMTGYFKDPEATAQAFDEDGYFHTGDVAYVDEDGYYFIVDRLKEMFISGGENVYPAEIEEVLSGHPDVEMCAVIGVEDEDWGEVGRAFVVLRDDIDLGADDLKGYVDERLASYKVPKSVVFRDSLPISGAGKILKKELKETDGTE